MNYVIDENKNNYCVYKHAFPDGKVYIGITGNNPIKRWGHGCNYYQPFMREAIKKYGWDNIKHEILFDGLTKEDAEQKEKELINQYDSTNPSKGYNLTKGGNCRVKQSKESRIKISIGNKGKFVSEETKQKISKSKKGIKVSEEARKHMSIAHIGVRQSEESKRKILLFLKSDKNPRNKKIAMLDKETNVTIKIFKSTVEAGKYLNKDDKNIATCARGKTKSAYGYKWMYIGGNQYVALGS